MVYLCFYGGPFLAHTVGKDLPHLLTDIEVSLGQRIHLGGIPVAGILSLGHQPFMSFATSIGRLVDKEASNRSPIEILLSSSHQPLVHFRIPGVATMPVDTALWRSHWPVGSCRWCSGTMRSHNARRCGDRIWQVAMVSRRGLGDLPHFFFLFPNKRWNMKDERNTVF